MPVNLSYEIIERANSESSPQNFDGQGVRNDLSSLMFDMQSSTPIHKTHHSGYNSNRYANGVSDSATYNQYGVKVTSKKRSESTPKHKPNLAVDINSSLHEDLSHLKFRHGDAGNYVKDLLSRRAGSPQHFHHDQRKADNDLSRFDSFLNQRSETFERSPMGGTNKSNVFGMDRMDSGFYPRTTETSRRAFV